MAYLFDDNNWTMERLEAALEQIEIIAKEELKFDYYPIQIEIVDCDEMLNLYSSNAMPIMYPHWSFGKDYIMNKRAYDAGAMGLAFEIVQNVNPCIAYCMDTNSMTMQALVMAHAGIGHNAFFKSNYLFKTWSDASSILEYMQFAKNYILECEQKYGPEKVEEILDCCHSLQFNGIDRYKRPQQISVEEERALQKDRERIRQQEINVLWNSTLPEKAKATKDSKRFPEEPEENLLYFIEKYSPVLETWEREIVRIVRRLGQFWFPNMQTRTINEGFACWTHYYIMNRLWEKELISDGSYMEFIRSHTSVVWQPRYNDAIELPNGAIHSIYNGINPYALGFEIFKDIERVCKNPTDEDREWFPEICGTNYIDTIRFVMENFRDDSFIQQFMSPKLMRDWRLFYFEDAGADMDCFTVKSVSNDQGYKELRTRLARLNDINTILPNVAVWNVDLKGSRRVELRHFSHDGIPLSKQSIGALKNFKTLWGHDVILKSIDVKDERLVDTINLGSSITTKSIIKSP